MLDLPHGRLLERLASDLAPFTETPSLDASVLLAAVLERSRAWVLAHPEVRLTPDEEHALQEAVTRLRAGEPLPYVLGSWEFFGLRFKVSPAALIPRPETELLVEHALAWLKKHPEKRRALDVGTGTGCIATCLAVQHPDIMVTAVDISEAALGLAQENLGLHLVEERTMLVQASLASPFAAHAFDLVCANLPYIPSGDLAGLQVARFEPWAALDGGGDGLKLITELLKQLNDVIRPGGMALLEIEERQGPAVLNMAHAVLPAALAEVLPDLAGKARILKVQFSEMV